MLRLLCDKHKGISKLVFWPIFIKLFFKDYFDLYQYKMVLFVVKFILFFSLGRLIENK